MVKALGEKKVVVNKIKIKESKTTSIQSQLQSFAFQDPELKYLGQRVSRRLSCSTRYVVFSPRRPLTSSPPLPSVSQAFISYLKSVYIQKNKDVFQVGSLPVEKFAESLGLPGAPQIKFISQEQAKKKKNRVKVVEVKEGEIESADEKETVLVSLAFLFIYLAFCLIRVLFARSQPSTATVAAAVRTKYDRMFEKKNQNILSEHYSSLVDHSSFAGPSTSSSKPETDDIFTLKRVDHTLSEDEDSLTNPMSAELSKRKLRAGESRKAGLKNKGVGSKLVFDEAGEAHELYELVDEAEERRGKKGDEKERFVQEERERLARIDVEDREVAKEKKREKKRKMKDRERDVSHIGG